MSFMDFMLLRIRYRCATIKMVMFGITGVVLQIKALIKGVRAALLPRAGKNLQNG